MRVEPDGFDPDRKILHPTGFSYQSVGQGEESETSLVLPLTKEVQEESKLCTIDLHLERMAYK